MVKTTNHIYICDWHIGCGEHFICTGFEAPLSPPTWLKSSADDLKTATSSCSWKSVAVRCASDRGNFGNGKITETVYYTKEH
jgi:hypothetical protein